MSQDSDTWSVSQVETGCVDVLQMTKHQQQMFTGAFYIIREQ